MDILDNPNLVWRWNQKIDGFTVLVLFVLQQDDGEVRAKPIGSIMRLSRFSAE